jgi:hypothetical protein
VFERPANTIHAQLVPLGDFFYRQTHQEPVFGDGQFAVGESIAVSQADYVLAVCQAPDQFVDSSSDNYVSDANQPSQLPKAAAPFQVHRQQQPILAAEQADSAAQQIHSSSAEVLGPKRKVFRYV